MLLGSVDNWNLDVAGRRSSEDELSIRPKIMGLCWGILRTMKDHEKQLRAYINMMIYNGFQWYLVVFYSLNY